MAEIWLAADKEGNNFALRRLYNTSIFGLKTKKLFVRGCEILEKIHHHPNLIGYYEHGKIEGLPYVLLEYVEGHNLKLAPSRFPKWSRRMSATSSSNRPRRWSTCTTTASCTWISSPRTS